MASLGALLMLLLTMSSSCSKQEGDFGKTTLIGKVFKQEFAGDIVIREYYSPEERVYITYGDNLSYDDWMRTSYDGSYKFENLTSGDYRLFAYTACSSCASGVEPVFLDVVIDGGDELMELPDLTITD